MFFFVLADMEQEYPDFTTEDEMCSLTLLLDDACKLYVHKEVGTLMYRELP